MIALLPFDEDDKDPNSEKYKEERAIFIEEKNAEIAGLEKRSKENDLIATFELALEYNSESDTESRKKSQELFSKTVYIFDNMEYEYVSEENSWKRLEYTGKALYFLGKYSKEGRLEKANEEKAKEFFMQGMFYGNDSSAYEIGQLSERGYWSDEDKEYKQDIDFAIGCYKTAAKKGNWLSESELENYNIKIEKDSDSQESDSEDDFYDEEDDDFGEEDSDISSEEPSEIFVKYSEYDKNGNVTYTENPYLLAKLKDCRKESYTVKFGYPRDFSENGPYGKGNPPPPAPYWAADAYHTEILFAESLSVVFDDGSEYRFSDEELYKIKRVYALVCDNLR